MTTTLLSAIVALGLAAAPRPSPVPPQHTAANTPAPSRQVTVQVQNDNFSDVDVYARSEAMTWRLGTVMGMEKATFTLPGAMVGPDVEVQLIFAPIAGWRYWASPPVLVSPGDRIVSQVGDILGTSTVVRM
jgi:hypothetical protein